MQINTLFKLGLYKLISLVFIVYLLLALLVTINVHAAPGLSTLSSSPDSTTGQYQTQIEDIKVKVQGGYVRIVRTYEDGKWQWNKRWNPIELYGIIDANSELAQDLNQTTTANDQLANLPFAVVRNEAAYLWTLSPTHLNQLKLTDRSYTRGNKTFTLSDNGNSYIWHDKNGNTITYSGPIVDADDSERGYAPTLQIASYSDKNSNTVTFNRNSQGKIDTISVAGQTILSYTYNAGNLQYVTDYTGRRVEYHYTDGLLTAVRDVRGEVWHYHYNQAKYLTGTTYPEGFATTLNIDANGILQSQQNDNSNSQDYISSYSKAQDQYYTKQTNATGTITERWSNALGQTVRLDINGETRYTVDIILNDNSVNVRKLHRNDFIKRGSHASYSRYPALQNMPAALNKKQNLYIKTRVRTDAQGDKTRTDYDRLGNITKISYPDGGIETRRYLAGSPYISEKIDETGIITEYRYDSHNNLIEIIDAQGTALQRQVHYQYDEHGNRTQTKVFGDSHTDEIIERSSYDQYGNLSTATDGEGNITQYTDYDALGNIKIMKDARGNTWTNSYDNAGNLLSASDPNGRTIRYHYDNAGKRIKMFAPDNTEITLEYDGNRVVGLIEPSVKGTPDANSPPGYKSILSYDKAGRLQSVTNASGQKIQTNYSDDGRLKERIDGNGNIISYHYQDNKLDRIDYPSYSEHYQYNNRDDLVSTTINADGQLRKRSFSYNRDTRKGTLTDANNYKTDSQYDILGRLISITNAQGGQTHYQYDNRDNLIEVIDPEGRSTQFQFDKKDRLIAEIKQANNTTTHYSYDEVSNLTQIINANGGKTSFSFSDAGQLTQTNYYKNQTDTTPEKTVDYSYNPVGQMQSYNDGITQASYDYNAKNQLTQITTNFGNFTKTLHYSYYPNGQKKSYTNPEGIEYNYTYDDNGQLHTINIPDEGIYTINSYSWFAPNKITYPGGAQRIMDYDDSLRLTDHSYQDPAKNQQHQASYSFDNEDTIQSKTTEQGDTTYQYDSLYRLTDVSLALNDFNKPDLTDEHYTYDKVGNRKTSHQPNQQQSPEWLYNDNNQLIQAGTNTYTYDNNGNRITKTDAQTNHTSHYHYNTKQRLIKVESEDNATNTTQTLAEYTYNPFWQRTSKTVNNITTYYLYSQEGLIAEYDETGNLKTEYHYQPNSLWMTNPIFMRTDSNQQNPNQILYYYTDQLGTPQALYTRQGALRWQASYSAFGQAQIQTLQQPQYQVTQNLRLPGQYFDQETGLHYNMARDYDPEIGRYIQTDPIGLAGGLNRYAYAGGSPVMAVDVFGLITGFPSASDVTVNQKGMDKIVDYPGKYDPRKGTAVDHNYDGGWTSVYWDATCTCKCNSGDGMYYLDKCNVIFEINVHTNKDFQGCSEEWWNDREMEHVKDIQDWLPSAKDFVENTEAGLKDNGYQDQITCKVESELSIDVTLRNAYTSSTGPYVASDKRWDKPTTKVGTDGKKTIIPAVHGPAACSDYLNKKSS